MQGIQYLPVLSSKHSNLIRNFNNIEESEEDISLDFINAEKNATIHRTCPELKEHSKRAQRETMAEKVRKGERRTG